MTARPNVLAISLARGGSKSVPRKNVLPILGVPLIAYTIAEARRSRYITRYLVSTDDAEIQAVARAYGADAPFLRPAEFSGDTATSVSALQHAVAWAEAHDGVRYDYVVELMVTNPMKTVDDIDGVIQKLVTTGADSVIAMIELDDHHPARIKKIEDDRIVDFCVPEIPESRRQDLRPRAYIRNGAIYGLKRDVLMVEGRRYGTGDSRPFVMPSTRSVNVDSPIDFLIAEALLTASPRPHVAASLVGEGQS
jgi:CMP-N,N'-diacetyllegionaminic acid synthase